MNKEELREHFDRGAPERDAWYMKNLFYHKQIQRFFAKHITPGKSILEIGCSTGNLLASFNPQRGV